jgi:signal transduction histidine kinase
VVSICLFRVAQEALQNIVQHSHAETAAMVLSLGDQAAVLRISDDGVGLDPSRSQRIGLTCIREQVLALDGRFDITSPSSKGTVIEVVIPIKEPPNRDLD